MKYFVTLGGTDHAVEITRAADGAMRATLGERDVRVELSALDAHAMTVRVGQRVFDLVTERDASGSMRVHAGVQRGLVSVQSERDRSHGAGGGAARTKERDVRSPMPGRVVKVLVNAGDVVGPGQAVAVVEAMKMENDVRAVRGGTVARVHVAPGGAVEGNGVLVSFEP